MAQPNLKHTSIEKECLSVLSYFQVFEYPLTASEAHQYFPSERKLYEVKKALEELAKTSALLYNPKSKQYALRGHGTGFEKRAQRKHSTQPKIMVAERYAHILSLVPCIWLVGLSGSCSMENASRDDDIDICIISAPGCIWLSRIVAICIAKILGIHRSKGMATTRDKVCLNLFFDGSSVQIPKQKQNAYIAHEIVQMKPLFIRGKAYVDFFEANDWYRIYLPNAKGPEFVGLGSMWYTHPGIFKLLIPLELLVKWVQKSIMKPKGQERIDKGQLWFFPDDFEKKLRKKIALH